MFNFKSLFIYSMLFFFLLTYNEHIVAEKFKKIIDNHNYFEISVPIVWKITNFDKIKSFLKVKAISPQKDKIIKIYTLKSKDKISLKKLSKMDHVYFKNLGTKIKTTKNRSFVFYINSIDNIYFNDSNKIFTKARFLTDYNYGYVLISHSRSNNFHLIEPYFETFKSNVPFLSFAKKIGEMLLIFGLIIGFLALFGYVGFKTRKKRIRYLLLIVIPLSLLFILIKLNYDIILSIFFSILATASIWCGKKGPMTLVEYFFNNTDGSLDATSDGSDNFGDFG